MKVTEEGTTNIIKWYQPESSEECRSIDCRKCVFYSYVPSSSSCPFEAWMINHPVKELSIQEIVAAAKRHGFGEPSSSTSNIVMILNEINQNIIKLSEVEHEQTVPAYQKVCPVGIKFSCAGCYPDKEDQVGYEVVEPGQVGDLCNLPFMPNANESEFGKDFYHYCKKRNRALVRLFYDEDKDEHICPLCNEVYLPKQYDPRASVSKSE